MPSDLAFFILGAFIAALAAGLAGFAFGLIASGLWLHVLAPAQAVPLIAACGLAIHIFSIWRFRSALRWCALWPFLLGGVIGIPLGTLALQHAEPAAFRIGVGVFLMAYSGFMLLRPPMPALAVGGRLADGCVGAAGGFLGGLAGLSGALPTIWCDLRGWPKDAQRGVYQSYILVIQSLVMVSLLASGGIGAGEIKLFGTALPALALGAFLGFRLYDRVDPLQFRRVLLLLLLISGAVLLV
ncbi:MAG: sulfite exporter TauE/SafE family protein [Alphaproteobacteria bacterium]|nr:sulfite exporter TauE/SafE family protein [Alphaproteobacteria bacterium]